MIQFDMIMDYLLFAFFRLIFGIASKLHSYFERAKTLSVKSVFFSLAVLPFQKFYWFSVGAKHVHHFSLSAESLRDDIFKNLVDYLQKNSIDVYYVPKDLVSNFNHRIAIYRSCKRDVYVALNNLPANNYLFSFPTLLFDIDVKLQATPLNIISSYSNLISVYFDFGCKKKNALAKRCCLEIEFLYLDDLSPHVKFGFPNNYTRVLYKQEPVVAINVLGRELSTWAAMASDNSLLGSQYDVDLVYTWVDGNDPEWQREKDKHLILADSVDDKASDQGRFVSREELRFSLRSAAYNTCLFRNIYIVTNGQVPNWLNTDHPKIKVIHHKDLFRDPDSNLPTFNSHAIESNLHRLPELSKRFVYMNDDFFFYSEVNKQDLFNAFGKPYVFLNRKVSFGAVEPDQYSSPYVNANRNSILIVLKEFNKMVPYALRHAPQVNIIDTLSEIEGKYNSQVVNTERHRFRHHEDISMTASLGLLWGVAKQDYEIGDISSATITLSNKFSMLIALARLVSFKDRKFLCLNEAAQYSPRIQRKVDRRAIRFMEESFPIKSEFEV